MWTKKKLIAYLRLLEMRGLVSLNRDEVELTDRLRVEVTKYGSIDYESALRIAIEVFGGSCVPSQAIEVSLILYKIILLASEGKRVPVWDWFN